MAASVVLLVEDNKLSVQYVAVKLSVVSVDTEFQVYTLQLVLVHSSQALMMTMVDD